MRIIFISLLMLLCSIQVSAERVDMKSIGAKADGKSINTKLIHTTITRLNAAGGGTLFFPAGTYLTGPIRM